MILDSKYSQVVAVIDHQVSTHKIQNLLQEGLWCLTALLWAEEDVDINQQHNQVTMELICH